MKKTKFCTKIFNQKKHKVVAELKDGYTDGKFNYYNTKPNSKYGTWWAIEPTSGLAVAEGVIRNEVVEKANDPIMSERIKAKLTEELVEQFQKLVLVAQMEVA